MNYLIVVDMQNDFIDGSLGTREASAIVPSVAKKIRNFDGTVIFTMDTHFKDYLHTQEGMNLPVEHCIKGTDGWKLPEVLDNLRAQKKARVYEKNTFGSIDMARDLQATLGREGGSIEIIGLCTDICVVSNALIIKAFLPEVPITVDQSCCAGVTPQSHRAAIETMRSCQIHITGE